MLHVLLRSALVAGMNEGFFGVLDIQYVLQFTATVAHQPMHVPCDGGFLDVHFALFESRKFLLRSSAQATQRHCFCRPLADKYCFTPGTL